MLQKVVDGIVVIAEGSQTFTTTYGQAFYNSGSNRAFVQLEYFGYMKRDPDDTGYAFWLGKLNQFGGNCECGDGAGIHLFTRVSSALRPALMDQAAGGRERCSANCKATPAGMPRRGPRVCVDWLALKPAASPTSAN